MHIFLISSQERLRVAQEKSVSISGPDAVAGVRVTSIAADTNRVPVPTDLSTEPVPPLQNLQTFAESDFRILQKLQNFCGNFTISLKILIADFLNRFFAIF